MAQGFGHPEQAEQREDGQAAGQQGIGGRLGGVDGQRRQMLPGAVQAEDAEGDGERAASISRCLTMLYSCLRSRSGEI